MYSSLIVHADLPGPGGAALNRRLLEPNVPEGQRLMLYGEGFERLHRLSDGAFSLPPEARLACGRIPFGFLDMEPARPTYISVIDDPEVAFLDYAAAIADASWGEVLLTTGQSRESLETGDPDRLVRNLLNLETVRLRRVNAMTRLCAGLPTNARDVSNPAHLRAARANLSRTNYFVGVAERLDPFIELLGHVFDWPARATRRSADGRRSIRRSDLGPATRDALRAAIDLDVRLHAMLSDHWEDLVA